MNKLIEVAHYCQSWDLAWIEPGSSEWVACICYEHVSDKNGNQDHDVHEWY